jgi:hypothetical protein
MQQARNQRIQQQRKQQEQKQQQQSPQQQPQQQPPLHQQQQQQPKKKKKKNKPEHIHPVDFMDMLAGVMFSVGARPGFGTYAEIPMGALETLLGAKDHTHPPLTKSQYKQYKILACDTDGEEHYLFSGSSETDSSEADDNDDNPVLLS